MIDGILRALLWIAIGYLLVVLPVAVLIGKCIKWGYGEDEGTAPKPFDQDDQPVKLRRIK